MHANAGLQIQGRFIKNIAYISEVYMDIEKKLKEMVIPEKDYELRKKNIRTILEFMTDEEDAQTGEQKTKRLNRYRLYKEGGQGYRYGAGYTYKGEQRLRERDATTVRRFPVWYTKDIKVYQTDDPNLFLVTGYATGDQYDDDGHFVQSFPPEDPCHNLFIMEDGLIVEYIEYVVPKLQFPHDVKDIEVLKATGQEDQIL